MSSRAVELKVGGQVYRVVSSASDEELQRLAAVVDDKLLSIYPGGRHAPPQALLLAALALAHDVEAERSRADEERSRADALAARAKRALERLLERVDEALEATSDGAASQDGSGATDNG